MSTEQKKQFTYHGPRGRIIIVHEVDEASAAQARDRIIKEYFPDWVPSQWKLRPGKS